MTEAMMTRESAQSADRLAATLSDDAALYEDAADRIRRFAPTRLVTVARGSSDHAAEYAGRLAARMLGLLPASLPPSIVTLANAPLRWEGALVLAISQSGASPDIAAPVRAARAGGALTVALVNAPDSPLAAAADIALPIAAGEEKAVAATKSQILSMAQAARLFALVGGDTRLLEALPAGAETMRAAARADWSPGLAHFGRAAGFYVVGRGLAFAVAREAALKLKEVCGLQAEAMSGAEIMHGPKATIAPGDPLLVFDGVEDARASTAETVRALSAIGARIAVAGEPAEGASLTLPVPAMADPRLDPLAKAAAFFPFCAALAAARGLDPDTPRNLRKVTETV